MVCDHNLDEGERSILFRLLLIAWMIEGKKDSIERIHQYLRTLRGCRELYTRWLTH